MYDTERINRSIRKARRRHYVANAHNRPFTLPHGFSAVWLRLAAQARRRGNLRDAASCVGVAAEARTSFRGKLPT